MHATLGDRERIAGGVAADDQGQATDVTLGRAAKALDTVGRLALPLQLFEANDLLPDAEDVAELEQTGLVRANLEVDAVQRAFVFDEELAAALAEGGVPRRQVAVAGEDGTRVATDGHDGRVRHAEGAGFAAVGAQRGEDDA